MKIKRIVLSIILLGMVIIAGCFDYKDYPKYGIDEIGKRQYILTTPEGIPYVMHENELWFPEILYGEDVYGAIGVCDLGYVYETTSEICLFTSSLDQHNQHYFYLESINMPELSIENINNAVLKSSNDNESQIVINKQMAEKLIKLYNLSETHEVKEKNSIEIVWELDMECEQFRGLYFWSYIYTDGIDYYMLISRQYDSHGSLISITCCKCTSVVESILENN